MTMEEGSGPWIDRVPRRVARLWRRRSREPGRVPGDSLVQERRPALRGPGVDRPDLLQQLEPIMMNRERYEAAPDFREYLETVERNRDFWHDVWARTRLPAGVAAEAGRLAGPWKLLALSEDWCGDGVNVLPYFARLADEVPGMDLRVLGRDANPDLMDAHLTGTSRSIPVVILYDADFVERGWWGPRPAPIQRWVLEEGLALPSPDRYREIRRWFARDRGATTMVEFLGVLRAASPGAPPGRAAGAIIPGAGR